MKSFSTFFLFIFSITLMTGQKLPDSTYVFGFENGELTKNYTRNVFTRTNDSMVTIASRYDAESKLYTYSAKSSNLISTCANKSDKVTFYSFNETKMDFDYDAHIQLLYDNDCYLIEDFIYVNFLQDTLSRNFYSDYDGNGNYTKIRHYENSFTTSNLEIQNTENRNYVYNPNNSIKTIFYNIDYNGVLTDKIKVDYEYDDQNREIFFKRYIFNTIEEEYELVNTQETFYNVNSRVKHEFTKNFLENETYLSGIDTTTLDNEGDPILNIYYAYDSDSNLINSQKTIYFYPTSSQTIDNSIQEGIKINNVKSGDSKLSFSVSNPKRETLELQLIDYQGHILKSCNTKNVEDEFEFDFLSNSIHFIVVRGEEGVITKKVMVF